MKKVIGMLAVVAFASSMASAELLKNFKYNGSIEVNMRDINNGDFNKKLYDNSDNTRTRVMIGANFDLADDVSAQVTAVKNARNYGNASQSVSGGTIDTFFFEEAYLNLKGVLSLDHKVGRQYYGNPGDLVIYFGPSMQPYMNTLPVSGLDGWTGWYGKDKLSVHGIMAKRGKANSVILGTDQDIRGIVGKYDLMEEAKIGAFLYEFKTNKTAAVGPADILKVYGVKANGKFMGFGYNAEMDFNGGRNNTGVVATGYAGATPNNKYSGSAFLANVDYGYDFMGKWKFMGEYLMTSGEKNTGTAPTDKKVKAFMAVNTDYRPGLVIGAETGVPSADNTTVWNLGATYTPEKLEKLTGAAKLYHFAYTEKQTSANTLHTATTIGDELDLSATWTHSPAVSLMASYGVFSPNKKWLKQMINATATQVVKTDAWTRMGLDLMVKF